MKMKIMKKGLLIICALMIVLIGCGEQKKPVTVNPDAGTENETTASSDDGSGSSLPKGNYTIIEPEKRTGETGKAVCINPRKLNFRKGEDFTSNNALALIPGQTVTFLGLSMKVQFPNDKNIYEYYKIRLADGTEGWAWADFIAVNTKAGVVLKETSVYSQPSFGNKKMGESLNPGGIVAVDLEFDSTSWIKVYKSNKDIYFYIPNGYVTTEEIDLGVAQQMIQAVSADTLQEKRELLKSITDSPELINSPIMRNVELNLSLAENIMKITEKDLRTQARELSGLIAADEYRGIEMINYAEGMLKEIEKKLENSPSSE